MSSDVVGQRKLPPDPKLVKTLGANHSLPTALADLVDNSIDAGATRVLIRFLRTGHRLVEIHVVDDGHGLDADGIGTAMTLGAGREYEERALGQFGVGLKAAALSTGDTLTLWSQRRGSTPVGLRLNKQAFQKDYSCDELSTSAAAAAECRRGELLSGASGTTVALSALRADGGASAEAADAWLHNRLQDVRTRLGLVFHRLLTDGRIRISLDEGHLEGARGVRADVAPVDPFGYAATGRAGYPRTLKAPLGKREVRLHCHIWPARQSSLAFRLGTRDGQPLQGFYVYRGDRLLSAGGWLDVTHEDPNRMLGRVALEYEDVVGHVTMNPEKSSITFDSSLNKAIHQAAADGRDFADFLRDVEDVLRAAKVRQRVRKPAVPLDKGFAPGLRRAIAAELDVDETQDPVSIKWKRLPQGELLDVDFSGRTVWLNNYYRSLLAGEGKRGINDAPVLKALVFLLTRDVFKGQYLGPKHKDDIALWQQVLAGAVQAEGDRWSEADE